MTTKEFTEFMRENKPIDVTVIGEYGVKLHFKVQYINVTAASSFNHLFLKFETKDEEKLRIEVENKEKEKLVSLYKKQAKVYDKFSETFTEEEKEILRGILNNN